MADTYSIKFNHGASSFEVEGPNETWVDAKVNELKALMEALPTTSPISNAHKSAPSTPKKASPKTGTSPKNGIAKSSLEDKWSDDLAAQILAYIAERQDGFDKGATKQAAILAVFLKDNESVTAINPQDMELIYRKLGWPTISHANQLDNARKRDRFFEKTGDGYELTHAGTVFGRDTSKAIAKDKK